MTAMTASERRYYAHLGQRIRAARQKAGLTQQELGRRLEVSHVVVCHWERVDFRPSAWHLAQLDRIFGEGWR